MTATTPKSLRMPTESYKDTYIGSRPGTAPTATAAASAALSRPITPVSPTQAVRIRKQQKLSAGSRSSLFRRRSHLSEDPRRDSALAPSVSNTIDESVAKDSKLPIASSPPVIPAIIVHQEAEIAAENVDGGPSPPLGSKEPSAKEINTGKPAVASFPGLTTIIPSGDLEDPFSSDNLEFSKRGSVLWGGEKALGRYGALTQQSHRRKLSREEHILSRRIRTMYEYGHESAANWEEERDSPPRDPHTAELLRNEARANALLALGDARPDAVEVQRSSSAMSTNRRSLIRKEPNEAAGGMEDWQDVRGGEVDRYGFISPKSLGSRASAGNPRLTTSLTDQPRNRRSPNMLSAVEENPALTGEDGRPVSNSLSHRASFQTSDQSYTFSKKTLRPSPSLLSNRSKTSGSSTVFRMQRSPHNKGRRWMDNASDMLALPPGFEEEEQPQQSEKAALLERKRDAKWAKMAKVVNKGPKSGGMNFSFETTDSKLISRTWKGIPNRWRPTAWYAFLEASAKRRRGSPTEEELIDEFNSLQEVNCGDDTQIDMDVPRTISRHIMFRRRYRGGQRSLFRLLHAIALYFPDIGYVQGMAPLAATLLCYYDEERAFVMLVRLWQLRGLEYLYQDGFPGLFAALTEFEKRWLAGRIVAKQLKDLGISSTAYGTKWYLTLFNYSIPFAAQLRVWDVLMLLGDTIPPGMTTPNLDVLHATSAALIDGVQEILLDSDFESAMKVLTAPIAVGKEDTLMKIAKHEWKEHRRF